MDASRKRPIPRIPLTVGIVTSPNGAVVHDALRTFRRRFPLARMVVAGVPVEGPTAARDMTDALQLVCDAGVEVILLCAVVVRSKALCLSMTKVWLALFPLVLFLW